MNNPDVVMKANFVESIGITLFHALWQGAVIAAALALVQVAFLRKARPEVRLAASWTALAAVIAMTLHTFLGSFQAPRLNSMTVGNSSGFVCHVAQSGSSESVGESVSAWMLELGQLAGIFWLVGLVVATARVVLGWLRLQRLCRLACPVADQELVELFERERIALKIREKIQLKYSHQVDCPVMAGFLWPVVILPPALLSGVPVQHLRALLSHELAHFRRWDYVSNLVLAGIEAFYFFQPAVWWICHTIRVEREHACDDLVINRGIGMTTYARALATVEAMRRPNSKSVRMAMAADGGSTLARIERLAAKRGLISIKQGIIGDRTLFHRILACFVVGGLVLPSAKGQFGRKEENDVFARGTDYEAAFQKRIAAIGQAVAFLDQPIGWADHGNRLFVSPVVVEKSGREIRPDLEVVRLFEDLPNEWLLRHRLDILNANLPSTDPDGDGFTVLEEFRGGTDPMSGRDHPPLTSKLRFVSQKGQFYCIRFDASTSEDRVQLRKISALLEVPNVWIRKTGETTPDGRIRVNQIAGDRLKLEDLTTGRVYPLRRGETLELPTWFAELRLDLVGEKPFFVKEGDAFRLEREPDVTYRLIGVGDGQAEIAILGQESDPDARIEIR